MSDPRPYHSPLREDQARRTRTLILSALIDLISEQGAVDLSIRDLAARAGVSQRTVYRHFPDRRALLDGLADHVGELAGWQKPRDIAESIFEIPDLIPGQFAGHDEHERETRAVVLLNLDPARTASISRGNRDVIRGWLAETFPSLDEADLDAAAGLFHLLVSSRTWLRLRDEAGLEGRAAGEAVRWVLQLILDSLSERGRVPRPGR